MLAAFLRMSLSILTFASFLLSLFNCRSVLSVYCFVLLASLSSSSWFFHLQIFSAVVPSSCAALIILQCVLPALQPCAKILTSGIAFVFTFSCVKLQRSCVLGPVLGMNSNRIIYVTLKKRIFKYIVP